MNLKKPPEVNYIYFKEVIPSGEFAFYEKKNEKCEKIENEKRNMRLYKHRFEFKENSE